MSSDEWVLRHYQCPDCLSLDRGYGPRFGIVRPRCVKLGCDRFGKVMDALEDSRATRP